MNVFTKCDEIPSMTLQDIKETKRHGHTFVRSFRRTDVKTEYPPTNTVCGGYNYMHCFHKWALKNNNKQGTCNWINEMAIAMQVGGLLKLLSKFVTKAPIFIYM